MSIVIEPSDANCTVGVVLIKLLEHYDVEHVFGIPGVHTIELYRGLAASCIRHHTPRHEQGAGFMADGYARISQKPGVCFVITGPGLTNIATAMGQALADSIPMLVISSVNDNIHAAQAQGRLHEMPNQQALASEVSRFSQTIKHLNELPDALARAFSVFSSARPGPVHLQIPVSMLGAPADHSFTQLQHALPLAPVANSANLAQAAALINASRKPFILAGGGARAASQQVRAFAEKIDAPVHLTINARGLLPYDHELAVSATCTLQSMRTAIDDSDVVIALGTELSATDYDQFTDGGFSIRAKLVRCDIDPLQLANNQVADVGLVGDVVSTLKALSDHINEGVNREGALRAQKAMSASYAELSGEIKHHLNFLETLRDQLPGAVFVGDSTQLVYSGNMIFNTAKPQQWFNSSTGFGTLGFALPAATGAALANISTPVVCIIGDGGLQFVLGELGALKDTALPVAIIVWSNNGYREIKTSMEAANVSTVGVEFTVPDFVSVAEAYGINAVRLNDVQAISKAISTAHSKGEPILIDVDERKVMGKI